MTAQARFKYSLAALESLYAHRLEEARLKLAHSQQRLDAHREAMRGLRQALQGHHADWVRSAAVDGCFDPARHEVVRAALGGMQGRLDAACVQEVTLLEAVQACRERVLRAHRRSDTVDRHKQDAAREFHLDVARAAQRQSDDAWPLAGVHDDCV